MTLLARTLAFVTSGTLLLSGVAHVWGFGRLRSTIATHATFAGRHATFAAIGLVVIEVVLPSSLLASMLNDMGGRRLGDRSLASRSSTHPSPSTRRAS